MRLNRFLAASGEGSRRSCEQLVIEGRVTINGKVCQNLATEVSEEDFVKVGGRRVQPEKHVYVLLHKPRGYLCTASDTHDRETIFSLIPRNWPRMFHVGRLDKDSEGLILLTNDGELGLRLTHPRYKMEKEYEVLLDKAYEGAKETPRLLRGVNIEGGRAKAELVRQMSPNVLRIVLRQGLKRQIRLMLYKVGFEVKRLIRIRIGPLRLKELRVGEWRALTEAEVKVLRSERPEPAPKLETGAGRPGKPRTARPPKREGRGVSARRGSVSSAPRAGRRP